MHTWLLDLLACPECRGALRLDATERNGDAVTTGTLIAMIANRVRVARTCSERSLTSSTCPRFKRRFFFS